MSTDLESAINSLYSEMESINSRLSEIKRSINILSVLNGKQAPFSETDFNSLALIGSVRPDQFFGKALATSVKEFLKMNGRAMTAQEIYEGLKNGGYEFTGNKSEKIQSRNLSISLSKNSNDFVYVKSSNAYGLWEFYPEKQKEREKQKNAKTEQNTEVKNESETEETENKKG